MTDDIQAVIEQCEDYMFQRLSVPIRERSLYYHLLRHTRLVGREQHVFALVPLARALAVSETTVREDIRQLHSRGTNLAEQVKSRLLSMIRMRGFSFASSTGAGRKFASIILFIIFRFR